MPSAIPELTPDEAGRVLWPEYALARRPVVVRGLFADQPIAGAGTAEGATRLLGGMPVLIREEYSRVLGSTEERSSAPESAALEDYLRRYGDVPDSGQVVTELEAPPALLGLITVPEFCRPAAPVHDVLVHSFLAGPSNYAHLHFDQDQRHVLLAQVFGRKRVVVLPPSASRWIHPFGNLGSIRPQAMSQDEREHFLALTGGVQTIIEPGDAVYMPPLVWHYTDYLDLGMSFNIRFRRNEYNRFLSADNFLGDRYLQALSAPFSTIPAGDSLPPALAEIFAAVTAAFDGDHTDRSGKYRAIRRALRDISIRHGLEREDQLFLFPLDEVTERQAERAMRGTFLYQPQGRRSADLMRVDSRPASAAQARMVRDAVQERAYPAATLAKVLDAMFARSAVEELTGIEALRFLAYLGSPVSATAFEAAAR